MTTIPSQSQAVTDNAGRLNEHWYRFLDQLAKAASKLDRSFYFEAPANGDYTVIINAPAAFKISSVTTKCASGTATLTVKINATALGGTANSVSSSEQTQTHSSANSVGVGDDLVFTFASVSSAAKVVITISGTTVF